MYPNARHMSLVAGRHFGAGGPGLENRFRDRSDRFNIYTCETFLRTVSHPAGYGMQTFTPAYQAGNISSVMRAAVSLRATGAGAMGLAAVGSAGIDIGLSGDAQAIGLLSGYAATSIFADGEGDAFVWAVFAAGSADVSVSASGAARLALITAGSAAVSMSAAGQVGGLAWVDAVAPSSVSASGLLRAIGDIAGTTADQGVTPHGIAAAVIASLGDIGLTPAQEATINQILLTAQQVQTKVDAVL